MRTRNPKSVKKPNQDRKGRDGDSQLVHLSQTPAPPPERARRRWRAPLLVLLPLQPRTPARHRHRIGAGILLACGPAGGAAPPLGAGHARRQLAARGGGGAGVHGDGGAGRGSPEQGNEQVRQRLGGRGSSRNLCGESKPTDLPTHLFASLSTTRRSSSVSSCCFSSRSAGRRSRASSSATVQPQRCSSASWQSTMRLRRPQTAVVDEHRGSSMHGGAIAAYKMAQLTHRRSGASAS